MRTNAIFPPLTEPVGALQAEHLVGEPLIEVMCWSDAGSLRLEPRDVLAFAEQLTTLAKRALASPRGRPSGQS